jgi:hypothetical protein
MLLSENFEDDIEQRNQARKADNANFFAFAREVAYTARALQLSIDAMWKKIDPDDSLDGDTYNELVNELYSLVTTKEIVDELNYEGGVDLAADWMARHREELNAIFSKYYNENTK